MAGGATAAIVLFCRGACDVVRGKVVGVRGSMGGMMVLCVRLHANVMVGDGKRQVTCGP